MVQVNAQLSTGLPGLDRVLRGVIPGDNIVWQIDSIDDYAALIEPYCESARRLGRRLTYFRFAEHPPLVADQPGVETHRLNPADGFEAFIAEVHQVIGEAGRGAWHVFDCLSDLASAWRSDTMLGNFFLLTCPYLYDVDAIAYFALDAPLPRPGSRRPDHGHDAGLPRRLPSQRPTLPPPVEGPTPALPHHVHAARLARRAVPARRRKLHHRRDSQRRSLPADRVRTGRGGGSGTTRFACAEETLRPRSPEATPEHEVDQVLDQLLRTVVTRDPRMLELLRRYLTLEDVMAIGNRIIGTGLIGGKAVGMLLGRAILKQVESAMARSVGNPRLVLHRLRRLLLVPGAERPLVGVAKNTAVRRSSSTKPTTPGAGPWWASSPTPLSKQFRDDARLLRPIADHRPLQQLARGQFRPFVRGQVRERVLRQPGVADPAIAGLHGGRADDLRQHHGRGGADAIATGAACSPRTSRWRCWCSAFPARCTTTCSSPTSAASASRTTRTSGATRSIPSAGVLRLVFGLGTRAVDRTDDDFPRVVALNAPERRPERPTTTTWPVRPAPRRRARSRGESVGGDGVRGRGGATVCQSSWWPRATSELERLSRDGGREAERFPWVFTFDKLLVQTEFVGRHAATMLRTLEEAYGTPVDVEYTTNFRPNGALPHQPRPMPAVAGPKRGRRRHRAPEHECPRRTSCWKAHGADHRP